MQAVQKQTKKPSFKCPAFSVPAKTKAEGSSKQNVSEKGLEQEKLKGQIPEKTTPDIENKNKDCVEQSKTVDAQQQFCKQQADGDNKSNNCDDISTDEGKNISMAGDCSRTSSIKDHQEEKQDLQQKDASQPSTEPSKKAKKKKTTSFKVKAALEESEDAENKQVIQEKKKKMEDGSSKMDKSKQIKEKKEKKPKAEKKEILEKKPTLPVRSLTDEEYSAIFETAIENAMNLNMEEWEPKVSPPVKVKEPVKKKYSVTVGKKKTETLDKSTPMEPKADCPEQSETELHKEFAEKSKESDDIPEVADVIGDKHNQVDEKEQQETDEQVDENNNVVEEIEVDRDNAFEENVAIEILDGPVHDSAQKENETTPAGSEVDMSEKNTDCINTPVKKKKLQKINKKTKFEPKHLPFERKSASMIDKIKEMKEVKKEKQVIVSKKRKLDNGSNKAAKEQKKGSVLPEKKNRQKLSPKKTNKRQKMQERELELNGTWVQCCNSPCLKWRYLPDINDPILVPVTWTCSMNSNHEYNSCDKPEENYDESEHIYTKYAEGSVIWARMAGYPWWPAMVEMDPDTETFFSVETDSSMFPTHYHVVFFDEHVSRAWIKIDHIKTFTGDEDTDGIIYQTTKKRGSYRKDVAAAKKNALRALSCTIKERVELFGFASRYKGPWTSKCKSKSVKAGKTKNAASVEDCIDDRTMDDVLDNTDALLDNVEEMLDSIDSQLFDSDADSDFVPKELVVVETSRKKTEDSRACKEKQENITQENFAEDSEIDIVAIEKEEITDADRIKKTVNKKEEKAKLEQIETPKPKAVFKKLNLDSEIFTMEMESQEESSPGAKTDKKIKHEPIEKKDKKITKKRAREVQVPCEDKREESSKMKEKKTAGLVHLKGKKGKKDKSDTKEREKTVNTVGESQKLKKSSGQMLVTSNKDSSESSCKTVENVATSVAELVVHVETDLKSTSGKYNDVHIEKCIDGGVLCNDLLTKSAENTETEAAVPITLETENDITKKGDTGELVDLGNIEVDAHSRNIDESNRIVPDIDLEDSHLESQRNHEQSLEDESDGEFDLGEKYMYEINTDGSDKVRERALSAQGIMEVEEDSDPFELMEE